MSFNPNATRTLLSAVNDNCLIAVKFCLKHQADPNHRFRETRNFKPLIHAAIEQDVEIIQTLLENKADPNQTDNNKDNSLHILCQSWNSDDAEKVALLVKYGAKPNAINKDGVTPLHLAANKENARLCTALVQHGADINIPDKNGSPPLHYADRLATQIAINPTVIVNPICRQCHISGKAFMKCQFKHAIKRLTIRRIPTDCAYTLELQLHRETAWKEQNAADKAALT